MFESDWLRLAAHNTIRPLFSVGRDSILFGNRIHAPASPVLFGAVLAARCQRLRTIVWNTANLAAGAGVGANQSGEKIRSLPGSEHWPAGHWWPSARFPRSAPRSRSE